MIRFDFERKKEKKYVYFTHAKNKEQVGTV